MRQFNITMVCAESMAEGYAPKTHIQGLSTELIKNGHTVSVVGIDSGSYHKSSFSLRIMRYLRINWRAASAIGRSDVMLARGHFAHLPWAFLAWLRGKTVIHEMNGLMFDAATTHKWLRTVQVILSASYRWQSSMASGIACVSAEIAADVKSRFPKQHVSIIGNGVDLSTFFTSSKSPTKGLAVFPSSLAPWHGVTTLLDALEHPHWPKDVDLVIAGDGAQADIVMNRASQNPRIIYVGLLDKVELADLLRKATIGLCLVNKIANRGVTEVYPLKLFEMMASGLAIVATDLAGQRDVLDESGCGVLVSTHDSRALAKAVAKLHANPERRNMGLAGAEFVRARYGWSIRAAELEQFVQHVLAADTKAKGTG